MSVSKYLAMRKSFLFMIVGVLVFVLYLYFFAGFNNISELLSKTNQSQYLLFYSLTIVSVFLSMLFGSMAWHAFLSSFSIKLSLRKAFLYNWVGNFVDMVVPCETVCGEIARLYLVYGDVKDNFGRTVASVVGLRLFQTLVILGALVFGTVSIIYSYQANFMVINLLLVMVALTVISTVILLYLAIEVKGSKRLSMVLAKFAKLIVGKRLNTDDLQKRTERNLAVFHDGFEALKQHPRDLVKPALYTVLQWIFQVSVYFFVFYALGVNISPGLVILVSSIAMSLQAISAAFSVGTTEIVMTYLYTLGGISTVIGGTATAMIRIMTFWFQILVGFVIVQWVGAKKLLSSAPRDASLNPSTTEKTDGNASSLKSS